MLLVEFYQGTGKDNHGRTLESILSLKDDALDALHDWVQWVWPTQQLSNFNENAPIPSEEELVVLRADEKVQRNLELAYNRFMAYLGFEEKDGEVRPAPFFEDRRRVIWTGFNHNYLRVTRFLVSLKLLGMADRSKKVYGLLMQLIGESRINASHNARSYWTQTQQE
jgi:hypothetical protein